MLALRCRYRYVWKVRGLSFKDGYGVLVVHANNYEKNCAKSSRKAKKRKKKLVQRFFYGVPVRVGTLNFYTVRKK